MKTGIVTFHGANNYGAVLQVYALTQWLGQNGIDAEIIDYRSRIFDKYKLFRTQAYKKAPYLRAVDLYKYPGKRKRNRGFDLFREKYLPVSAESYVRESDFEGITDRYDCFICGSDQIWNPQLTHGIDPVYFLDFVADPKKKVAYAPSVALKKLNEFQLAQMAELMRSFAALSIREQEAIDLLQPYCEQEISKCCDPVFLPDAGCYDKICSKKYEGKKFVFLYIVGRAAAFKNVIAHAEKTAREHGLQLYYLIDGDKTFCRIGGKNVYGCNPCDFLSLIRNAEYVVSNSFHATAFSLLYARQFVTFLKDGTGSRMEDLLRSVGLENRIFRSGGAFAPYEEPIDCREIGKALQALKESSVDYLRHALHLLPETAPAPDAALIRARARNREALADFVEQRRHCWLVRHKDAETVAESRSGGVFTALSDAVLRDGGAVYGCRMEGPGTAIHARATTAEERDRFRKSKYIQSEMRDCFRQVREDLKNGLPVLFSGTGCQVAGLYSFLQGTDTAKLYTVDIVCHGTPSPRLWNAYLDWMRGKYGGEISEVQFRNKRYGWKAHLETVRMGDALHASSAYRVLFLKNAFLRPSCYECPFSSLRRKSDITIGDAWGIEKSGSPLNDNKGCSIVLVNSENGRALFERCRAELTVEEADLRDYLQDNLYQPSKRPADRQKYFDCLNDKGFDALAGRYGRAGILRRMRDRKLIMRTDRR